MATYQPRIQNTTGYIPANTIYAPTTTFNPGFTIDCLFLGTKFGFLKILQQIFIFISTILYICNTVLAQFYTGAMGIGFLLYLTLLFVFLPIVHVLMWTYLFRKVEKFSKYPWYTIEFAICGGGATLCCMAAVIPIYILTLKVDLGSCFTVMFTLITALLFIYNFYLVSQKKRLKLPLQGPVLTIVN